MWISYKAVAQNCQQSRENLHEVEAGRAPTAIPLHNPTAINEPLGL